MGIDIALGNNVIGIIVIIIFLGMGDESPERNEEKGQYNDHHQHRQYHGALSSASLSL